MGKAPVRLCAVYTRKSSEEGLDQEFNSLEAQREAGVAYVKSQAGEGWRLVEKRYDDGGFSGGTMDRPALKRLMADIEAGRVNVVVVYKVDRLTRSLADFAKLVEVFEARAVSFVSVTQQFNTTTSMGRLMLNVLLSFAQFEREVTGERIRDKIAASKKKGMWMGGVPPIGYEAKDRRLVVVQEDAETVRHIFGRYIELGCITLLAKDLAREGLRTRRYISAAGRVFGGCAFSRGHLHRILNNRLYLGEIAHRGSIYPGEHNAIVDEQLWSAVQAKIEANRCGRRRSNGSDVIGLLGGKVFDDAGNAMTPTRARKGIREYRYYVSRALLEQRKEEAGTVGRVSAVRLEAAVMQAVEDFARREAEGGACSGSGGGTASGGTRGKLASSVRRVTVGPRTLKIELFEHTTSFAEGIDQSVEVFTPHGAGRQIVEVPFEARKPRGSVRLVPAAGRSATQPGPDTALVKSLVRGNEWARMLLSGEAASVGDLARSAGVTSSYVSRLIRYAFLAPEITQAILDGTPGLDLSALERRRDLPMDWTRQRLLVGL